MPGGDQVARCFDCGTCTGACPVSESGTGFDPRKILHMIKMGLKAPLLDSSTIWHCTHCDTCLFVCPQNIRFSTVVDVLRKMALDQGYAKALDVKKWGTAPCKAACPAHISIPGFVGAIADGGYEEGLRLIKEEMPFPGICGRICPHPCETECNRGDIDAPIAIESLKRFLADVGQSGEAPYIPEKKPPKNAPVAVIGAGPAGLSAAYYLAIEGYPVTVFERLPVAGGMMAVGIPEFRLPRAILESEIDVIRKLGVDIKLNIEIGKDILFSELQKEYKAVFLGLGCQKAMHLGIHGEDQVRGVLDGLTYMRDFNLGQAPAAGGTLIIIGGGNTAVDCARTAKRLGYDKITIIYRRTRTEMPASPWEVDDTLEEDVDIQFLTAPVKILGRQGKVCGVECIRMKLGKPDDSGRRRPIPVEGSEFVVEAGLVVAALGQTSDVSCLPPELGIDISKRGLIVTDPNTAATNIAGIFSGGDVATGPATVVQAVAFGKKAALSIDRYLSQDDLDFYGPDWQGIAYAPADTEKRQRESILRLSLDKRKATFKEVDLGFTVEQARCEADRCLKICGMQRTEPG
jgi:NADPH-dependent glutamate synthase beta subunit-like oxidoreductase